MFKLNLKRILIICLLPGIYAIIYTVLNLGVYAKCGIFDQETCDAGWIFNNFILYEIFLGIPIFIVMILIWLLTKPKKNSDRNKDKNNIPPTQ